MELINEKTSKKENCVVARGWVWKGMLVFIVLAQIVYTMYVFHYEKQGAHSDEVWSYGLSNSYYQPFIDLKSGVSSQNAYYEDMINWESWIPGEVLWEYITVQKGERFAYRSVYYNNTYDVHPPLYYMILHTVCSFFPERFSWSYGLAVNLFFLVGTQVFLYCLVRKVYKSEILAVITCFFYGGSMGALYTFTFIRQYTLLVMLCVAFVYISACFYERVQSNQIGRKYIIGAAFVAWLSFVTHYYGIVFIGIFTAAICACLLLQRKWQAMFSYGTGMFLALGGLFAVYPVAVKQLLSGNEQEVFALSAADQMQVLVDLLLQFNYGFGISALSTTLGKTVLLLIVAGVIVFIFLRFIVQKIPAELEGEQRVYKGKKLLEEYLQHINYIPLCAVMSCFVIFEVVANTVDIYHAGIFVMRYTSMTLPFIAMAVVGLAHRLIACIAGLRKFTGLILTVIACAVLIRIQVSTDYMYGFKQYCGNVDVAEEVRDKTVLVVDEEMSSLRTDITYFTGQLYQADAVCFTSGESIGEGFLLDDGRVVDYIIVDTRVFRASDQEKQDLSERGNISFAPEEAEQHPYACTNLLKEIAGNRHYEIMSIWKGQTGSYYILKFL